MAKERVSPTDAFSMPTVKRPVWGSAGWNGLVHVRKSLRSFTNATVRDIGAACSGVPASSPATIAAADVHHVIWVINISTRPRARARIMQLCKLTFFVQLR